MKIIITESQLNYLIESEEDKAVSMMEEIKSNIDKLLDYYEKTDDGNYVDKQTRDSVNLKSIGGFFKNQIESIVFGVQLEKKPEDVISKVNNIKNQIINGKLKDFFGDYNSIEISPSKFDHYSQKKCVEMNPKSPGCKV